MRDRSLFFWITLIFLSGFVLVQTALDFDAAAVVEWFKTAASSPFAVPGTILIYVLTAFASVPQWMLHTGSIVAFGPVFGSLVAWIATMVSACFDFWLGRRVGSVRMGKINGRLIGRFIAVVREYGFWTSLVVRIVPTGPFVFVNMAAGAMQMRFWFYFFGTAIGIIPKIIIVALVGKGVEGIVVGKGPVYVGIVITITVIWVGCIYIAGLRLKVPEKD